MKDEEAKHPQDELARLRAENARLRTTIDRLERQRGRMWPVQPAVHQAKRSTRLEKIRDFLTGPSFWDKQTLPGYSGNQMLMAIMLSNLFYGLALVITFTLAEPSTSPPTPWAWVFIFVWVSPLPFVLILSCFIGEPRYFKPYRIQRITISKRYLLMLLIGGGMMAAYAGLFFLSLINSWGWLTVVLLVGPIIWGIIVWVRKRHARRQPFEVLLKKLNEESFWRGE